jgi:hypothetical protein
MTQETKPEETKGQLTTADLAYPNRETTEVSGASDSRVDGERANAGRDATAVSAQTALLSEGDRSKYQEQWGSIQTKFIDEPKECVQEADALVAGVIQQLATKFAEQRSSLEQQWGSGGEASTEDLRQALQHYRSFFQRLLAA